MNVRINGDWEGWIKFFLKGIAYVSDEATESAKQILELQSRLLKAVHSLDIKSNNAQILFSKLFENPYVTKQMVSDMLNVSKPTASVLVKKFCELNILTDITPNRIRYKTYVFKEYMEILERGTELTT